MRTEQFKGGLLLTLVIASMMLPAILLLSANPASGEPDQVIIYPVADIEGGSFMMSSPQLKFDISSIPSGAKIISAKLWLYVFYMMGGRNYYIMRVEDQDWDETITPIEFDSQTVTDVESFFSLYGSWGYVSVENQLIVDHSAGRTYASFRLSPVDSGWSTEGIVDRHVLSLAIGIYEMNCYSSEYDGYDPYLEVNYYLPPVAVDISPTYQGGSPGVTLTYTITVKNNDNIQSTYLLTAIDNAGWPLVLSKNLLENVQAGENRIGTLNVTVPENSLPGEEDEITVTATSLSDNTASDNANCIARAIALGLVDTPWPKFRHDEQNTGRSPYVGAQDNALKWSYAIGCGGVAWVAPSPAVGADGTIYMGSDDGNLYALNPDGTLKWFYQTEGAILSSPAIGNGAIYVASSDGRLYALDEKNGILWWTFNNVYGYPSPAIGPDGTIYIGSYDSYFSSLSALHENGDLKWSFSTGLLFDEYPTVSCPAIGPDGTIYFTVFDWIDLPIGWAMGYGPVGWLFALDENGALKWFRWAGGTSPAVGADGTIYVASGRELIALNQDNTLKWSYVIGRACSSPAIGTDGTIFVGGSETLHALNPDNTLKWSYATGGIIGSSPAVGAGTVYVGSGDNKLYAFSENGTLMWTYSTGGEVYSSPAIGAGGMTYVGSNDGKLYAIGQRAKFSLVTLYEIGLDVHLWLEEGSKLILKFNTYMGDNQGDNLVWENVTPAHVVLLENIPHPQGKVGVQKTELVLMDEVGATISTLSTFIVRKVDLEARFMEIPMQWAGAPPEGKVELEIEFMEIPMQWAAAPS